jgi:FixJ family two-component response regulator
MHQDGHIIIIEDDAVLNASIQRTVARITCDVTSLHSVEEWSPSFVTSEPTVLLLDVRLPAESGVSFYHRIATDLRHCVTVFMSGDSEKEEIIQVLKTGASDFLLKPFKSELLVAALKAALAKSSNLLEERKKTESRERLLSVLTARETEVIKLTDEGYGNIEIGNLLGISAATAKLHKANAFKKLNISTASQLAPLLRR